MTDDRPHVRLDPAQQFGRPTVSGVSVEAIGGMLVAGETVATVADEYGLTRADVLVACWWLGTYGTQRWRRIWAAWAKEAHQSMWLGRSCNYDEIPDPPWINKEN